jgi:cardiolipin synthase A/B
VGSVNGGEVSHKINREVSLLVNAPPLYDRMVEVFQFDWIASGGK